MDKTRINNFIKLKSISISLIFLSGILTGIVIEKIYPVSQLWSYFYQKYAFQSKLHDRKEIALTEVVGQGRLMVAIVFGQSNSANYGEKKIKSGPDVYNFYQGKFFAAEDPLLGAEGGGGSVWTRLGDMFVKRGVFDSVVFVPLGRGASSISEWTRGGDLHGSVLQAIKQLSDLNLTPTHLLWHQGETDSLLGTSAEDYKSMFKDMLKSVRSNGVEAPIYVSVASRCKSKRGDPELQRAQRDLVDARVGIFAGPDTDQLGLAYRYDGCHFTDEGLQLYAELWYEKLVR